MSPVFVMGILMVMTGGILFYLASPNQQVLRTSLSWSISGWGGAVLMLLSLPILVMSMQALVAVFLFFTMLMLVWVVLPYIGVGLKLYRKHG